MRIIRRKYVVQGRLQSKDSYLTRDWGCCTDRQKESENKTLVLRTTSVPLCTSINLDLEKSFIHFTTSSQSSWPVILPAFQNSRLFVSIVTPNSRVESHSTFSSFLGALTHYARQGAPLTFP